MTGRDKKIVFSSSFEVCAAAHLAAAPRAPKLSVDIYKDATIDAEGRAHAPFDGYEHEGIIYRGGEYLPEPDRDEPCAPGFDREMIVMTPGPVFQTLYGTRTQHKAIRAAAKEAAFEHDSGFVGEIGKRQDFELVLVSAFYDHEASIYGGAWMLYFRDDSGDDVRMKTTSELDIKTGDRVVLKATTKNHYTSKAGANMTFLQRPKLLKKTPIAAA